MEAVGIEPTSRCSSTGASTRVVRSLNLARNGSSGRDPFRASPCEISSFPSEAEGRDQPANGAQSAPRALTGGRGRD